MTTITLKGREIPLIYTTYEMKTIMDEIGPIGRAIAAASGRNPEDPEDDSTEFFGSMEHITSLAKLIRILGNAGLEEAGEVPDLKDKGVMRALKPSKLIESFNLAAKAMAEGMDSEIPDDEDQGPVDVTLENMKKKDEAES